MAVVALGGCSLQLPTGMSPTFSLTGSSPPPVDDELDRDTAFVAPDVEYYCEGPDFDPNAPCLAPKRSKRKTQAAVPTTRQPGVIVVSGGDTLYSLARRHRVSAVDLADLNGLEGTDIYPGQELEVPSGADR
ncbi:MAG: LysM peptidoglycan-binding domain-containing protein [Alphaproteobacteria bacterium]|nr:LysM peptidoglycan-binding domain-containing protein [Alphaproteobacteria bacterium]